jgi:chromosome segregation ATPase
VASPETPGNREFLQMRHDVDDAYSLLDGIAKSVTTISATQRRHGNRLEELQQSLDLQSGRMDRLEDNQRQQGERLGRVEGRLDGVDQRLGGVDQRLGGVDQRLGRIEDTQQEILTLLRGRSGG